MTVRVESRCFRRSEAVNAGSESAVLREGARRPNEAMMCRCAPASSSEQAVFGDLPCNRWSAERDEWRMGMKIFDKHGEGQGALLKMGIGDEACGQGKETMMDVERATSVGEKLPKATATPSSAGSAGWL